MKKYFCVICLINVMLLSACVTMNNNDIVQVDISASETPFHGVSDAEYSSSISPDIIDSFFTMNKDEIINYLNEDYQIVYTGPDGAYEGYYYKAYGLAFAFMPDDTLELIFTTEPFKINGASAGMVFSEIKECLGDAETYITWYEFGLPYNMFYNIEYKIGKCRYVFGSFEPDDTDWASLTIYPERRRYTTDYFEWLFRQIKCEILKSYSINDENGVYQGAPELVETPFGGYEGYYFGYIGITLVYNNDESLLFVFIDESIEITGAGTGMTFSEIKDLWGETKIIETQSKDSDDTTYSIEYIIGELKYVFLSSKPDGDDSILYISRIK